MSTPSIESREMAFPIRNGLYFTGLAHVLSRFALDDTPCNPLAEIAIPRSCAEESSGFLVTSGGHALLHQKHMVIATGKVVFIIRNFSFEEM